MNTYSETYYECPYCGGQLDADGVYYVCPQCGMDLDQATFDINKDKLGY